MLYMSLMSAVKVWKEDEEISFSGKSLVVSSYSARVISPIAIISYNDTRKSCA